MFIFNTELLMTDVDSWYLLASTVVTAVFVMLLFAAGTQGHFLVRSRLWESLALILIAFTMFRSGYWMDKFYPPLTEVSATKLHDIAGRMPADSQLRIRIKSVDLNDKIIDKSVMLPLGPKADGKARLLEAGLEQYLLGPNAARVVRHAKCSVSVIRD